MSLAARIGAVIGSVALLAASLTLAAGPASADEVWHQAFQRASADAPCPTPANQTPWQDSFRGQQAWTPSWAQWANDNTGGFVCQRSIIWAHSGRPAAFCIQASPDEWLNFLGGWSLPVLSPDYDSNPDCSDSDGNRIGWDVVYAPSGWDPVALCIEAFGTAEDLIDFGFPVYGCKDYRF